MRKRIQKLRDAAEHESCIRCGMPGKTVLAHYTGPRQYAYGKGTGTKGHDVIGADLCNGPGSCHEYFDKYVSLNDVTRSEEFLHLCALTIIRRIDRGVLR